MSELERVLLVQAARRPALAPRDAVKLLHQSEFGPGHLIEDEAACLDALRAEWEGLSTEDDDAAEPAAERIGGGFARVSLRALREPAELRALGRLFLASARPAGSAEGMTEKLRLLESLTAQGRMPFSPDELAACLGPYRRAGCPAIHHSPGYRQAHRPAYRVVREALLPCLAIAAAIERRLAGQDRILAAIDGRCGSGKSTLAAQLGELYRCEPVEMDHFFLPPELRTRARLDEPGGNIHYERFEAEVVAGLRRGGEFSYRVFDCARMDYGGMRRIEPEPLLLCEGSYSHHPRWVGLWDLEVFTTCPPQIQRERLLLRGGPALFERFEAEWIPMEERYFEAFGLPGSSALTLDTARMTLNGEPIPWLPAG